MASPLFSIVVCVHNARAYVRQCLDSILGQDFHNLELIAVDSASPDGSGEILDERAVVDDRVRVVHLDTDAGPGAARNAGLTRATGTYLLFVDGDDAMTGGSLSAIERRLEHTGSPEILVFDYARTYWTNRSRRNAMGALVAEHGPDVFRLADRPELLSLLAVVWNKAYRRDWIESNGFEFPPGCCEDVAWTYPAMITAQRIAVLDRVCYDYRQRRPARSRPDANRSHFDAFDQYARTFAYLDRHPQFEQWRTLLFGRMLTDIMAIANLPGGVDASLRREWFDRSVDAYHRFVPTGYQPPPGVKGVGVRALAKGNYAAIAAARGGGAVGRNARARVRTVRRRSRRTLFTAKRAGIRAYYKAQLTQPLDENLAVYSAYWSRGFSCNPAAIYEEATRIAPQIHGVWVVRPDSVGSIPAGVDYVLLGSPEYYRVMARAKFTINNVNFGDNIVKRPGSVHVQTNHGTPLKSMGLQLQDFPLGAANMDFAALLARCDKWDYLISSNRYSSEIWERAYPCNYVTLETGYPRNDKLVRATSDDTAAMRAALDLPDGKTVVLYAPTFRDWERDKFVAPLALEDLCRRLGEDYIVLVRGHYFTRGDEGLLELQQRGMLRDVSAHPVLEELMIASDVLLTDYSSIMFDYANLDRPIVIYAEDWDLYRSVRGANFDLLAAPPGAVATEPDALVDVFHSGRYGSAEAAAVRNEFRRKFCTFDDGHAAERVVRRVLLGEESAVDADHAVRATGTAPSVSFPDDTYAREQGGRRTRHR